MNYKEIRPKSKKTQPQDNTFHKYYIIDVYENAWSRCKGDIQNV